MAERLLPRLPKRLVAKMPAEYLANEAEYWQQREELLADYSGRWLAFDQGQVVASGSNFSEVLDQTGRMGHPLAYVDCMGAEGEMRFRSRRVEFSYGLFADSSAAGDGDLSRLKDSWGAR